MTLVEKVARELWKWEGLGRIDWNDSSFAYDKQTIMRRARRIIKMCQEEKK